VKANPKDPDHFPFFVFGNKADKDIERKVQLSFAHIFLDPDSPS